MTTELFAPARPACRGVARVRPCGGSISAAALPPLLRPQGPARPIARLRAGGGRHRHPARDPDGRAQPLRVRREGAPGIRRAGGPARAQAGAVRRHPPHHPEASRRHRPAGLAIGLRLRRRPDRAVGRRRSHEAGGPGAGRDVGPRPGRRRHRGQRARARQPERSEQRDLDRGPRPLRRAAEQDPRLRVDQAEVRLDHPRLDGRRRARARGLAGRHRRVLPDLREEAGEPVEGLRWLGPEYLSGLLGRQDRPEMLRGGQPRLHLAG